MSEHTPLPWRVDYLDKNGQRIVTSQHIEICTCWHHCVGSIEKEMEANAALIVSAVNSHSELIEALWECETALDAIQRAFRRSGGIDYVDHALATVRTALAKAKGETT